MNILAKSVKIIDPSSPHNRKTKDILIEKGKIKSIADKIKSESNTKIIEASGLSVSPGWFDLRAHFCDPGFEYKEDILSGLNSAMQGGFTGVAVMPSTSPAVHSKSIIEYIIKKANGNLTDIFPVGAVTRNLEGKELAELYDMFLAGAVAFSDDKNSISDAGVLLRAFYYAKNFNGLIMHFPDEKSLSAKGMMHEGEVSASLGMTGIPSLSEQIIATRDLLLANEAETKIHLSTISTYETVAVIRAAKKRKEKVTSDIAAHQLAFSDESLSGFDSNYKVNPPFRTKKNIDKLIEGLADDTIDVICSDHTPQDIESKKREFDYASNGIIGLETCFAVANTFTQGKLSIEKLIEKISINPRKILELKIPSVKEGESANITFFDSKKEWVFEEKFIQSKSKNSPFIGMKLKGKAIAVCNNGLFHQCL